MSDPNLLGNGKLTVASRLASVASAAVLVGVVAVAPFAGSVAWNYADRIITKIDTIGDYVIAAKIQTAETQRQIDGLDRRVSSLEARRP